MIVTAYNNGQHHPSGAGYGLRLSVRIETNILRETGKKSF